MAVESRSYAMAGWYTPRPDHSTGNKCVVEGCEQNAAFHLCREHAVPGMLVNSSTGSEEHHNVISMWLVKSAQGVRQFLLNDYALGRLFGGRGGLEIFLAGIGYQIVDVVASETEIRAVTSPDSGIPGGLGPESLPGFIGYDSVHAAQVE